MADFNGFMTVPGKPDERIGIVTFNVPEKTATSPVTVVVHANPWQTVADRVPGPGPDEAHLKMIKEVKGGDGKVWLEYRVTLDGIAPIDPSRNLDLSLLGDGERPLTTMIERLPTKDDPSYTVVVQGGEPIRRVILQSQSVERARFENVHLRPNP